MLPYLTDLCFYFDGETALATTKKVVNFFEEKSAFG